MTTQDDAIVIEALFEAAKYFQARADLSDSGPNREMNLAQICLCALECMGEPVT